MIRIILGSKSDLKQGEKIKEYLALFDVKYDFYISSAHRKPEATANLAKNAQEDGIKVIIAAAGMAAHLPGVIASHTILPVIGVPLKSTNLEGIDALYSVVQMPTGVPVATVAIDGGKNAAILAAQILALSDEGVKVKLEEFKEGLKNA
ncbi:MAG: 5-(carboxyamino)imidazole ribonucleotide mutase [Candidatus Cloacimonadota bacterium]|nr:5-(carboxyamino)imidazole ribonucleotide mutase [Candidatus Cloacimonadota bacterium]